VAEREQKSEQPAPQAGHKAPLDRETARDLILGGDPEALVGHREGSGLDVKGSPYRLDDDLQKYELAKDVSAFANQQGGLLLIPAHTRLESHGEVITDVGDLDPSIVNTKQIRDVIHDWIYPPVLGLEVEWVKTTKGRGRLLIHVPPQEPESWPHVVTHALIGERLRGTSVAIFVRHDADDRSLHSAALHGLLAAGNRSREREGVVPAGQQVEADPPVFEPAASPSTASFNFALPAGPLNAHLQNVGAAAALVDHAQLQTPAGTFDGLMWLQEGRSSSVLPQPRARIPRDGHLIIRFEDHQLAALPQSSGALNLTVIFREARRPGRWEYKLELLRSGNTPGDRLVWRGGAERTRRLPDEPD
jgi:hypothetical protein